MKIHWGHAIVLGFILFAGFVFTLVFRMITSGNDLVKTKYYRTGAQINQELNLERSSEILASHFRIGLVPETPGILEFRFDSLEGELSGSALLICLSSDKADQQVTLQPVATGSAKIQKVNVLKPKVGNWICEISGKLNADSFKVVRRFRM